MLTKRVRLQLVAFAVIAAVAVVYALFRFTDIGKVFGAEGYTVKLELTQSGGIFTNAEVTYRGYNVGRVGEIRLTHQGLQVDLNIEADAPRIPADLDAVVANRSAVGEQYVDLRPRHDDGPFLDGQSVIAVGRTKTPVGTDVLIRDLDSLASSVPTESLRTLVDELDKAFSGTGDDLQVLLDTTSEFTATATEHLPQTIALINDGGTVLDTQAAQSGNIKSFATDLNLLAQQLRKSDPDLRRLISATPRAATAVTSLLRESGPGLSRLFANLLTVSDIVGARKDGVEYTLVSYPLLSAAGHGLLAADPGQGHLGLVLNVFNPPPCTKGYEQTPRRNGTDTATPPERIPANTYCAEPKGSPINVRGSNNVQYGGQPPAVQSPSTGTETGGAAPAGLARGSLPGTLTEPGMAHQPSLAELLGLPG